MRKSDYYKQLQDISNSRGGECISPGYINARTKLWFRCDKNHTWPALPRSIKSGSWCPYCARTIIDEVVLIKTATVRGGVFCGPMPDHSYHNTAWRCQFGHEFEQTWELVRHGKWCEMCRPRFEERKIYYMKKAAQDLGGECISDNYGKYYLPIIFRCNNDHIFKLRPIEVMNGVWCNICVGDGGND